MWTSRRRPVVSTEPVNPAERDPVHVTAGEVQVVGVDIPLSSTPYATFIGRCVIGQHGFTPYTQPTPADAPAGIDDLIAQYRKIVDALPDQPFGSPFCQPL